MNDFVFLTKVNAAFFIISHLSYKQFVIIVN